jgi:hypothetical protein
MTVEQAISVLRSAINYVDYCTQCDDPDPKCKTNGDECTIALNILVKKLTSDNNDCTVHPSNEK